MVTTLRNFSRALNLIVNVSWLSWQPHIRPHIDKAAGLNFMLPATHALGLSAHIEQTVKLHTPYFVLDSAEV